MNQTSVVEALKVNLKIYDGSAGYDVVDKYGSLLDDFQAEGWCGLSCSRALQDDVGSGLLLTVCEAFWRLVFYYLQPRFFLLEVAAECSDDIDARIEKVVRPLQEKADRCRLCVDRHFSQIWLKRLQDPRRRVRHNARDVLATVAAVASPNSGPAERRHLHGQEARFTKMRGRALSVENLGKHTYIKSVVEEHRARCARVLTTTFGANARGRRMHKEFKQRVGMVHMKSSRVTHQKRKADGQLVGGHGPCDARPAKK